MAEVKKETSQIFKKILIRLHGYERILEYAAKRMQLTADMVPGVKRNFTKPLPLPTKIERWTVNRSPHIDKKARDQFERRTHYRLLSFEAKPDIAKKFIDFCWETCPTEVGMKVTEHTFAPLEEYYTPPSAVMERFWTLKKLVDQKKKESGETKVKKPKTKPVKEEPAVTSKSSSSKKETQAKSSPSVSSAPPS